MPRFPLMSRVRRPLQTSRTVPQMGHPSWFAADVLRISRLEVPKADSLGDPRAGFGTLAYMQRTTVKLPDDLGARLRHEAERRGTTVSELTREAIEAHLGGPRTRRRLLAAAAGSSGRHDISERIEEILANEVGASH